MVTPVTSHTSLRSM